LLPIRQWIEITTVHEISNLRALEHKILLATAKTGWLLVLTASAVKTDGRSIKLLKA